SLNPSDEPSESPEASEDPEDLSANIEINYEQDGSDYYIYLSAYDISNYEDLTDIIVSWSYDSELDISPLDDFSYNTLVGETSYKEGGCVLTANAIGGYKEAYSVSASITFNYTDGSTFTQNSDTLSIPTISSDMGEDTSETSSAAPTSYDDVTVTLTAGDTNEYGYTEVRVDVNNVPDSSIDSLVTWNANGNISEIQPIQDVDTYESLDIGGDYYMYTGAVIGSKGVSYPLTIDVTVTLYEPDGGETHTIKSNSVTIQGPSSASTAT
nr:hypothetical protein [Lachnospiraceae bacterium]